MHSALPGSSSYSSLSCMYRLNGRTSNVEVPVVTVTFLYGYAIGGFTTFPSMYGSRAPFKSPRFLPDPVSDLLKNCGDTIFFFCENILAAPVCSFSFKMIGMFVHPFFGFWAVLCTPFQQLIVDIITYCCPDRSCTEAHVKTFIA